MCLCVSKTSARNSEASTYISSRFALGASIGFLLVGTSASLPVFLASAYGLLLAVCTSRSGLVEGVGVREE